MFDGVADPTTESAGRGREGGGRHVTTTRPARRAMRLGRHLIATTASITIVATLFPGLIGASWGEVGSAATAISLPFLALLGITWAAGLAAHTITLSSALPGLSHRRALLLSLTGSAVANVLPLGGAAGIALNERMTRRWGFSGTAFAAYTVLTNVWDLFAKTFLPLLVIPLVLGGVIRGQRVSDLVTVSVVTLAVVGGVTGLLLFSPVLPRLVRRLERRTRTCSGRRRHRLHAILSAFEGVRRRSARVAVVRWRRLSAGMALYTALLFVLLLLCLTASGAGVPIGYAFLAFCGERLLTLIGLTPGAIGFVEVGLAGMLMLAPDVHGPGVAAGVLLYRLLTFGIEIPVGGALLAVWLWRTGPDRRAARGGSAVGVPA